MRALRLPSALLSAALLLAACGGDDPATPAADDGAQQDAPSDSEEEPEDTEPTAPVDPGEAAASGAYGELLQRAATASFDVSYDIQSGEETQTARFAQDPPNGYLETPEMIVVTNADGSFQCTVAQETCVTSPIGTSLLLQSMFGPASVFLNADTGITIGADVETSSETVAGRDALCAEISTSALGAAMAGATGALTTCVDEATGVLLETSTELQGGVTFSLMATSFTDAPDASVFELPYPTS